MGHVWEVVCRYWESPERRAPFSIPACALLTPEHHTWGLERACQFLAPTGLPSTQVSPGPVYFVSISPSQSLPVSFSLLFFSAVLPACLPLLLPRPPFLPLPLPWLGGGGAGGGSSTLCPPWGLILRGSVSERGGKERKGEKAGSWWALRVSVRVRL